MEQIDPQKKGTNFTLDKPALILVVGVAGSGKTSLAKELSRKLVNSAMLYKDLIQNTFPIKELRDEGYAMVSGPTVEIFLSFCDLQLGLGKTPIIESPFSFNHHRKDKYKNWVSFFQKVALAHHARLCIIRCLPPNDVELKKRLNDRGHRYDIWKLEHWEEWAVLEPYRFPIAHDDITEIITDRSTEELTESILREHLHAVPVQE